MARHASLTMFVVAVCAVFAGCDEPAPPWGADAATDALTGDVRGNDVLDAPVGACRDDTDCDNGRFCDGAERCEGGHCRAGSLPCADDGRSCTADRCDETSRACIVTPDHARCDDGNECNGVERCDPGASGADPASGCVRGEVAEGVCDDGDECSLDACDPVRGCTHAPRDEDRDGHVARGCVVDGREGDDCDDRDPASHPGAMELCEDGRDNDCDGRADAVATDACLHVDACPTSASAPVVDLSDGLPHVAPLGSLRGDHALGCAGPGVERRDAVFRLTLSEARDVTVTALGSWRSSTFLSVRAGDCASAASERYCAWRGELHRYVGRALPAGTYWILVENSRDDDVTVRAELSAPTTAPVEDVCPGAADAPATELNDGRTHTARLAGLRDDLTLSCNRAMIGLNDAVFRLTLTEPRDVLVRVSSPTGVSYASLRRACADPTTELACVEGTAYVNPAAIVRRNLGAGTWWVVVENTFDADIAVTATLLPAGTMTPEDRCPSAPTDPAVELNDGRPRTALMPLYAADHVLSCEAYDRPARRDVVYRLTLGATSTVRVRVAVDAVPPPLAATLTPPATRVELRRERCEPGTTPDDVVWCGASTVTRTDLDFTRRGLAAGTYWLHVHEERDVTVTATVTPSPAVVEYRVTRDPPGAAFEDVCSLPGARQVLPVANLRTARVTRETVPFALRFFERDVTGPLTVAAGGWLALADEVGAGWASELGSPERPNSLVAPLRLPDLTTGDRGVCYAVVGEAPRRRFVVEWLAATVTSGTPPVSFEAVIHEAAAGEPNVIDFNYQNLHASLAPFYRNASVGVENEDASVFTRVPATFTGTTTLRFTPTR